MTPCFLRCSKLPLSFANDRECIQAGLATCWQPTAAAVRLAVIPNTLELAELWVSPVLLEEARARPDLETTGGPQPLPFDPAGTLHQEKLFPHSVRARRG